MAGLQSGEDRTMIDSLTQSFKHITSTWQTHRQPHSHVAIANAAPTHCVGRQKPKLRFFPARVLDPCSSATLDVAGRQRDLYALFPGRMDRTLATTLMSLGAGRVEEKIINNPL